MNSNPVKSLKDVAFHLCWGQFEVKHERESLRLAPNLSRQLHAVEEELPSPTYLSLGTLTAATYCFLGDLSRVRFVAGGLVLVPRGLSLQMPKPSREEHKTHRILPPNPHRKARTDSKRLAWLQNRWLTSVRNIWGQGIQLWRFQVLYKKRKLNM